MSNLSSPERTPENDFGPLALSDLANRAEKAHAEHLEGYTAGTVLHRLYLAEGIDDMELRGALDLVLARLELWRVRTRTEWRQAYNAWAIPAGADPVPADPGVVDSESFAHVDEFDDAPLGNDPYDPHA
ncbi:hypothetical protein [Parafrankia sp. BMG5.11]|uniref:hypothetical protein n=1 Tax=Parafrankia sp. BMG5.11 TaxID=222540 RepID=UPI001A9D34FE|nr:hypothetical protein [Parafrankia sp. BMG5.11]